MTEPIELLYGRGTIRVTPPPGCIPTIVRKRPMPVLDDPQGAVERALDRPVGCPPLAELAR